MWGHRMAGAGLFLSSLTIAIFEREVNENGAEVWEEGFEFGGFGNNNSERWRPYPRRG